MLKGFGENRIEGACKNVMIGRERKEFPRMYIVRLCFVDVFVKSCHDMSCIPGKTWVLTPLGGSATASRIQVCARRNRPTLGRDKKDQPESIRPRHLCFIFFCV